MSHVSDLRAIVLHEDGAFYAQVLEHDIAAQGPDLPTAVERLSVTIASEQEECDRRGLALTDLPPAPERFCLLWAGKQTDAVAVRDGAGATVRFRVVESS